jgi:Tol biopolymer transport system component
LAGRLYCGDSRDAWKRDLRRFELIVGGLALVVLSTSVTLYIMNRSKPWVGEGKITVDAPPPQTVLSPLQLLVKPSDEVRGTDAGSTASSAAPPFVPKVVVNPDWRPGTARILGAQAVTTQSDYIKPVWSPVGLDIAFTRSDMTGVFVTGPLQTGYRMLADDPNAGRDMGWNIDGMSLRMTDPDGQPVELLITGEKQPTTEVPARVFERDSDIFLISGEGTQVQISGSQDRFHSPQLSPDERKVLYLGRQTGIYITTIENGNTILVGSGQNPTWLPDSSAIVFDIPVSDGMTVIEGDLWYASIDGRELTNLTNSAAVIEARPMVSPDGQFIAFDREGAICVGRFSREVAD